MASPTEITAFVVALVALVISLLQVVQQYMATAVLRTKIGRAATGVWSQMNKRRGLNFAEFKIREEYLVPLLTWEGVSEAHKMRAKEEEKFILPLRDRYQLSEDKGIRIGAKGANFYKPPRLLMRRKDDPENIIPIDSLPWADRQTAERYSRFLLEWDAPRRGMACTATWSMMMATLVGNPLYLARSSSSYRDADTIPSNLDNPLMQVDFSDLIMCGVLLDMKIVSFDLHKPSLNMAGEHCRIVSQEQSGVGMIARYICKPNHVHHLQTCTFQELRKLALTARGNLHIGDFTAHMTDWGYNSVDTVFKIVIDRAGAQDHDWLEFTIAEEFSPQCEGDGDLQWTGHWSQPLTTRVGFLLAQCGNPAIANSFPHSLLREWSQSSRRDVVQKAWAVIAQRVGFIEAPPGLCARLHENNVVMNDYKLASNWGAETGGIRGWCMNSFEEFVSRVSKCWKVAGQTEQVPILVEIHTRALEDQFSVDWAKAYNANFKKFDQDGTGFKPTADTLCWLQCMMLDTWIGRRVDLLITKKADEAAVPVSAEIANKYLMKGWAASTTAWKKCRSQFVRFYLARLADGIVREEDGLRVGVSCMSSGGGAEEAGWEGMPVGNPSDWAVLDAVLSLRAVLMATRFELMHNTDLLLELRNFDPMIQMA